MFSVGDFNALGYVVVSHKCTKIPKLFGSMGPFTPPHPLKKATNMKKDPFFLVHIFPKNPIFVRI